MRRDGEKTIGVLDYSHKIRKDHFIPNQSELKEVLDRIMMRRVFPEIQDAFNYTVTHCESYKIACYEGSRGGFFNRHRDNTTGGTRHRKFAMTLNLNADKYEGGYLRFPEYGSHNLYKPDTGSVIIFGCSVYHEATPVTKGDRYVLLAFFYGDKEAEERRAYESKVQNDYNNVVVV